MSEHIFEQIHVKPVIDGMDTLKNEQDSFKQKFIEINLGIEKCIDSIRENANDTRALDFKNTYAGSFEKVSFDQFKKDMEDLNYENIDLEYIYENLKLPSRATIGSAGYDFYLPMHELVIPSNCTVTIPTGIKVHMDIPWYLKLCPKSGLSFEYPLVLVDTIGIIDSDYYNTKNEGHIYAKIKNESNKKCFLNFNDKYIQGIFCRYGLKMDDAADPKSFRNGGFGSTSNT